RDLWRGLSPARGHPGCCTAATLGRDKAVRVASVGLANFRSFVSMDPLELGAMNVLIGPNNAGKSSVLRGLYAIQEGSGPFEPDIRLGARSASVEIQLADIQGMSTWGPASDVASARLVIVVGPGPGLDLKISTP